MVVLAQLTQAMVAVADQGAEHLPRQVVRVVPVVQVL
jgi:hypothetical protein